MWLAELSLTYSDRDLLLDKAKLTEKHIHSGQILLGKQFPSLDELQSTLM